VALRRFQAPPLLGEPVRGDRAFWTATAAYVTGWTAHTTFIFYLAPIALRLAGDEGHDAWVFTGTALASMLAVLPAGRLTDRVPRRRVLRGALALLAASYAPLLIAPPTLAGVLLATALTGAGLGFLFVSFNAYVPDLLAERHAGSAYGHAAAWSVLASAAGPAIAATAFRLAPDLPGLRSNAGFFAAAALVGLALTFRLPHAARHDKGLRPPLRAELPYLVPAVVAYGLVGMGYGMTLPYFTVHFLDHVRVPKETWGYALAVGTFATALGSMAAGSVARRGASERVLAGAQFFLFLASVAFAFPLAAPLLLVAFVARSVFGSTTAPVVNTILASRVHEDARGRAQGVGSLAWNVGWATGAAAGGLLLAPLGGALFPVGGGLAFVGSALAAVLFARAR